MDNKARQILARFLGGPRLFVPLKPKHKNRLAERRRKLFRNVAPRPPDKLGFKRFYRENYNHVGLRGMGRKQKRAIIKEWYRGG